jgi:arylsulfatase A-like enzyme
MKKRRFLLAQLFMGAVLLTAGSALAADKPNILVIWGDDIGYWNIGAYHRGMMAGETPHIDKLASEGAIFTDY